MISVGLAVPFTLGIVTAVNPCGFAMLPTWLGYFLGRDTADREARPEQVIRGLSVSLILTGAFVLVFGALGLAVNSIVSEEAIAARTPWVTVVLGMLFVPYGLALLTGRQVRIPFNKAGRGPRGREAWSVLGFGISYAVVSVGCAAPIFLLHVAGSFGRDGFVDGTAGYLATVRSGEAETERAAKRAKLKAEAKAKAKGKKAETAAAPAGEERADGLKAGSKLALLADTICRPEGATHAELCQVVGWRTCLPMAMEACKKAEISLRKEKEGNATRYFGTPKAR